MQYKSQSAEVAKLDRELRVQQEKLDRLRERQGKVYREYEEAAVALDAAHWNKEAQAEQRGKCLVRLQSAAQLKNEVEGQVKVVVNYYNNALTQYQANVTGGLRAMQLVFEQLFSHARDIVMKTLVYEISRLRNL